MIYWSFDGPRALEETSPLRILIFVRWLSVWNDFFELSHSMAILVIAKELVYFFKQDDSHIYFTASANIQTIWDYHCQGENRWTPWEGSQDQWGCAWTRRWCFGFLWVRLDCPVFPHKRMLRVVLAIVKAKAIPYLGAEMNSRPCQCTAPQPQHMQKTIYPPLQCLVRDHQAVAHSLAQTGFCRFILICLSVHLACLHNCLPEFKTSKYTSTAAGAVYLPFSAIGQCTFHRQGLRFEEMEIFHHGGSSCIPLRSEDLISHSEQRLVSKVSKNTDKNICGRLPAQLEDHQLRHVFPHWFILCDTTVQCLIHLSRFHNSTMHTEACMQASSRLFHVSSLHVSKFGVSRTDWLTAWKNFILHSASARVWFLSPRTAANSL